MNLILVAVALLAFASINAVALNQAPFTPPASWQSAGKLPDDHKVCLQVYLEHEKEQLAELEVPQPKFRSELNLPFAAQASQHLGSGQRRVRSPSEH